MNTLEVRELHVAGVVHDLALSIAPGERVGLIGESGSGKTLTALSIMRLIDSQGSITLGDTDLHRLPEKQLCQIRGRRVAMVFQEPMTALDPLLSVGKQIVEAIRIHDKVPRAKAHQRALKLLSDVDLSDTHFGRYPHELSGGQRQRVIIAMALAHNPELLICDEPTTALDVTSQKAIIDLILNLVATRGMSLLFITHDLGLVSRTCERLYVLQEGRIVEEGPAKMVLGNPSHDYTRRLLEAAQLPPAKPSHATDEVVIEVSDATKRFRRTTSVDGISLKVHRGERLGIVGGSGSGKTTLLKMIAGLEKPTSGTVSVTTPAQMVFQDPMGSLDPRMTTADIVAETLPHPDPARVEEVLTQVGIDPALGHRLPHEFSGGQRQRISIARAIAPHPQIVLADEPVSALDVSVRKKVLALIDRLVEQEDLTLVFVSHDIAVVRSVCTQVAVMCEGKVVEYGPADKVLHHPEHPYTRTLIEAVPRLEMANF
ncbi:ABC transporter ATP-binding protein [Corynebacterium sp. SCR221107]|uniref:ATP-binding cassette domain-containing protein n=1 Tax=Corynebacterium sp. SCR221107 TaxID=3017361 RepID=UPI0022EC35C1|nr:ABC transporter ATP-binding protein [Corynebacterium sp. SCR221107]WBT08165.1 ABC transporter ATP-binding protein [Corynebacterium sp. SCR221107]